MKIIELYQKGLSYKEIAKIVKCSEYKIWYTLILFYKMYKNANIYLEYKYNRFVALFGDE